MKKSPRLLALIGALALTSWAFTLPNAEASHPLCSYLHGKRCDPANGQQPCAYSESSVEPEDYCVCPEQLRRYVCFIA